MSIAPLRVGIIGMGGFAGVHQQALLKLEALRQSRLVCTCDPRADAFAEQQAQWNFAGRGVRVFTDYREMLDACGHELDMLVVPTPITLHAEMHRAGVERGIPVYLEKPPTLDPDELEAMIECDAQAGKATLVSFNFIIEKPRQSLKARLLAGEFGRLHEARLHVRWPRATSYFTRNNWAGRLQGEDGRLILDSCMGNAMAHFVHNLLYWAGTDGQMDWAELQQVRAELYRAHRIEGADTFLVQAATAGGVAMRLALTHACTDDTCQIEELHCATAVIRYVVGSHYEIRHADGTVEREQLPPFDSVVDNHLAHYRYLRGETDRPATRLVDSRPFVHLNNLAYVSAGAITTFPAERTSLVRNPRDNADYHEVAGLAGALTDFLEKGVWPAATLFGRAASSRLATPADVAATRETVGRMTAAGTSA
ncbi:MAG: Gfo/Idh/MocA family oxidoreductase [Verrucomicrobiota bacterium]